MRGYLMKFFKYSILWLGILSCSSSFSTENNGILKESAPFKNFSAQGENIKKYIKTRNIGIETINMQSATCYSNRDTDLKEGQSIDSLSVLIYSISCLGLSNENLVSVFNQRPSSFHYFIKLDGSIVECVPLNKKAWFAGNSKWNGFEKTNKTEEGIFYSSLNPTAVTVMFEGYAFLTSEEKKAIEDKSVSSNSKLTEILSDSECPLTPKQIKEYIEKCGPLVERTVGTCPEPKYFFNLSKEQLDSFQVLIEACQTYLQIKMENMVGLSEVSKKYPDTTLLIQEQIQRRIKK